MAIFVKALRAAYFYSFVPFLCFFVSLCETKYPEISAKLSYNDYKSVS